MPNLNDIERRINSVSSTKQITRTMEMVSAAKIRRATEKVAASTPYSESMEEMLSNVAQRVSAAESSLLANRDDVKNVLIVAVVSDRGLAGGFNSGILRHVDRMTRKYKASGTNVELVACGKKAITYFTYRGLEMKMSFADLSSDPTIEQAGEIANYAIEKFAEMSLDRVIVVYNHTKNAAEQILTEEVVLPVDTSKFASAVNGEGSASANDQAKLEGDMEFEPSSASVLSSLMPAYVRTAFFHALLDSAAGEQGARRAAMKSATDNANEMIETLTRLYNRVRQDAITTEISEIVAGAAALED